MKKQMFDEAYKKMAVELFYTKGSVKGAVGIDPGILSKWRQ